MASLLAEWRQGITESLRALVEGDVNRARRALEMVCVADLPPPESDSRVDEERCFAAYLRQLTGSESTNAAFESLGDVSSLEKLQWQLQVLKLFTAIEADQRDAVPELLADLMVLACHDRDATRASASFEAAYLLNESRPTQAEQVCLHAAMSYVSAGDLELARQWLDRAPAAAENPALRQLVAQWIAADAAARRPPGDG